jgi:hypothetical protein
MGGLLTSCAHREKPEPDRRRAPVEVVAVAPVLNLSGRSDWDPIKVTDILASELLSSEYFAVVPVNRALATLAAAGKSTVESADDALELARTLGADATLVMAITDFDPYEPPRVGLTLQYYPARVPDRRPGFDPVSASRRASDARQVADRHAPPRLLQAQRSFDAASSATQRDIREYGRRRKGQQSPRDWRVHMASQELFLLYSCWAAIQTNLEQRGVYLEPQRDPNEAEP